MIIGDDIYVVEKLKDPKNIIRLLVTSIIKNTKIQKLEKHVEFPLTTLRILKHSMKKCQLDLKKKYGKSLIRHRLV